MQACMQASSSRMQASSSRAVGKIASLTSAMPIVLVLVSHDSLNHTLCSRFFALVLRTPTCVVLFTRLWLWLLKVCTYMYGMGHKKFPFRVY